MQPPNTRPPPLQVAYVSEEYNAHSPPPSASPPPPAGPVTDAEDMLKELHHALMGVAAFVGRHPNQHQQPGPQPSQGPPQSHPNQPFGSGGQGYNGQNYPGGGAAGGPNGRNGNIGGLGSSNNQPSLPSRVNDLVRRLMDLEHLAREVNSPIPRQVLEDLDNARHPGHVTRERVEAVALENAFLSGKMEAISSYRDMLGDALAEHFPELTELKTKSSGSALGITNAGSGGLSTGTVKSEENGNLNGIEVKIESQA